MDDAKKSDSHLTSAAAFVEGGIQDACEDACSICLEAFCDSDPSTVTNCKHEFHLQCILEWCQRSSQCPMCWQPIGLKDPTSQELLEAVERERSFRFNPSRNATIFRHPTLGDFELQHLPVDASDAELEERIIQHLAAAAAMGRRHMARRDGHRHRSSGQGRPQFVVFSDQPNSLSATSAPPTQTHIAPPSPPINPTNVHPENSSSNMAVGASNAEDRAGPSEFQTFSDSIRTKLNSFSLRYKESIVKNTRGWKERLFSRGSSVPSVNVNSETATVSSGVEHVAVRENEENSSATVNRRADEETAAASGANEG